MSRTARKLLLVLLVIFGIVGLPVLLLAGRRSPKQLIPQILQELGISPQTAKYWVAVSAFETAGNDAGTWLPWNSRVCKDSNNLFGQIVPGSKRLQYGEGQTIFASWEDSIVSLYTRTLKPYKYPAHVDSLEDLVKAMKQRGYFTSDMDPYIAGVKLWYSKIYSA